MEGCIYIIDGNTQIYVNSVCEDSRSCFPSPCIVMPWTHVITPKNDIIGPCSGSDTINCIKPQDIDKYVWFRWGDKYLVYNKDVVDRVFKAAREAFHKRRPVAILLAGMTRTGKSTMSKLILEILNLPYVTINTAGLLSKYVGESESAIAEKMKQASNTGKSVIFEEFDAIMPVGRHGEEIAEVVKTRNVFLVSMDSLKESKRPALILATTNVDVSYFPKEVLNRFDVIITFPRTSVDLYKLYLNLIGKNDPELLEKAVTTMMSFERLREEAMGERTNDMDTSDHIIVYARADVITPSQTTKEIIHKLTNLVKRKNAPFKFTVSNVRPDEDPIVNENTVLLSALTDKPIIIARDVDEYYKVLREAKYLDSIVHPLFPIDPHMMIAAIARAPIFVSTTTDRTRVKEFTISVDSLVINGHRGAEGLEKLIDRVKKRIYERN